jgi:predicted amidophosphoribosyltransferase
MPGVRLIDAGADLLLGARCAGCDAPAFGLCPGCSARLRALRPEEVVRPVAGLPVTMAAGPYRDELRRVLLAAKERQALTQLPLLGRLLARAVAGLLLRQDPRLPIVLVPVPSVRQRVIERGIDLTAELARGAGRELRRRGLPVRVVRGVRLVRNPDDQAGLSRTDRLANSQGAYRCLPRSLTGSVIVIDDVVTTGATLAAVAAALRTAGRPAVGAATVAQTPRSGGPETPASCR